MDLTNLKVVLHDEPEYRLKQAKKAVFKDFVDDWNKATTLPLPLRNELNLKCPLGIKTDVLTDQQNASLKGLITLDDGLKIETVLLKHKDQRNTICVSSQIGCPLACSFCATGKMGFKRNLKSYEIVEQVIFWERYLNKNGQKVNNVVFMGMGEPFLNYENVLAAIRVLNDPDGLNIGARHISISTTGITPGIKKLANENLQINLAISLHAPNDQLRASIMPISKKYPIKKILEAVDYYINQTKRRVMFEYVMIRRINDSNECVEQLAKLMKKPLYFVNLITYNPTGEFQPSSPLVIKKFKEILIDRGVLATQRYKFGSSINAACGQLVGR